VDKSEDRHILRFSLRNPAMRPSTGRSLRHSALRLLSEMVFSLNYSPCVTLLATSKLKVKTGVPCLSALAGRLALATADGKLAL